jgi:hypothetical protein
MRQGDGMTALLTMSAKMTAALVGRGAVILRRWNAPAASVM